MSTSSIYMSDNTSSISYTNGKDKILNQNLIENTHSDTNSTLSSNSIESASDKTHHEIYQLDDSSNEKILTSMNQCPVTICKINTIGLLRSRRLLKVLFDSGSSACLINIQHYRKELFRRNLILLKDLERLQENCLPILWLHSKT